MASARPRRGFKIWFCTLMAPCFITTAPALGKTIQSLTPVLRADLNAALGRIVCTPSKEPSSLPLRSWQRGIYDAQIEGQLLKPHAGATVALAEAQNAAKSLARVRRYRGIAAGRCPDGQLFAAATPSGRALQALGTKIVLPITELRDHCGEWRTDYAAAGGGRATQLFSNSSSSPEIETKTLPPGTISITCQPAQPRWQGPVLWFLYPVGAGPDAVMPDLAAPTPPASANQLAIIRKHLGQWINRIRNRQGQKMLLDSVDLDREAELLAVDGNLTHNRLLLKHSADSLAEKKWRFVGEDRVKGYDLNELGWLLWNSPRHRNLLLSSEATGIGLAMKKLNGQFFAVIVLGINQDETRLTKKHKQRQVKF